MGYTHYWTIKETAKKEDIQQAISQMALVVADQKDLLAGWDGQGEPVISDTTIRFNGKEELAHETFWVSSNKNEYFTGFNFCKTARKPYDKVVVACMVVLKEYLKDEVELSSDGEPEELMEGIKLGVYFLPGMFSDLSDDDLHGYFFGK